MGWWSRMNKQSCDKCSDYNTNKEWCFNVYEELVCECECHKLVNGGGRT